MGEKDYFKSEEFKGILQQYEKAAANDEPFYMDADDLTDIAEYYHFEKRDSEAEKALDLAQQFNPDAVGVLLYRAHEALEDDDPDTAQEMADRLRFIDESEYTFLQGEIYIYQNDLEEAEELFRQAYHEAPADELMDFVYDVAEIYHDYGHSEKTMEWLMRSQGEESQDYKELLAQALLEQGKYKESLDIFNNLLDSNPYNQRYWNAVARIQLLLGDYNEAITSSEYAIAIDPSIPEGLSIKANALYALGNYEEALDFFTRFVTLKENDEYGYFYQGSCLLQLGRSEEALEALKKAFIYAPLGSAFVADIYEEMAFAYLDTGHPEEALICIEEACKLPYNQDDLQVVRGHFLLACKQFKEAKEVFRQALINTKKPEHTMLRIVMSVYDNHYVKAAYVMLRAFLGKVKEDWDTGYAYMALCCWDLSRKQEFLSYLEIAVEKNPEETRRVLQHLFPEGLPPTDYVQYMKDRLQ
ncbi:MAG: tetratricopeptide repeat protein [Prevotella sp.]|nr:tetratricopeptide repeat protein [Prevotella sp.]